MQIQVGIVTISDRASKGIYDDLGGPAVKKAAEGYGWKIVAEGLVADEKREIQRAIREQIASAVDLIVQTARMRDGSRKIISVSEIVGMEGDVVTMQEIIRYQQQGVDSDFRVEGEFQFTGVQPQCLRRFEEYGIEYDVRKLATLASSSALW